MTDIQALTDWVSQHLSTPCHLQALAGDAGSRQYFRVQSQPYIAVATHQSAQEDDQFIRLAKAYAAVGVHVPKIKAYAAKQHWMLQSDLGSDHYLDHLQAENADVLYQQAMNSLQHIRQLNIAGGLPLYDTQLLKYECRLFDEWFLQKLLGVSIPCELDLNGIYQALIDNALQQPQVPVHRDYHSRNLMLCGDQTPGVIDFQDTVLGPLSYDLVSLLKDCYIDWPTDKVKQWASAFYHQQIADTDVGVMSWPEFWQAFELMGVQRHLKCAGIFARLYLRDHKAGYLNDIERTLNYVVTVSEHYAFLGTLGRLLEQQWLGLFKEKITELVTC